MSYLKTTIYNALNGKMRDANQNEVNSSTNPRTKPAKNPLVQENEEYEDYWRPLDFYWPAIISPVMNLPQSEMPSDFEILET